MGLKEKLAKAAIEQTQLSFRPWEENPGIIALRKIHWNTKRGDAQRLDLARKEMPYILALWNQLNTGAASLVIPKPMSSFMNRMFERVRKDRDYARRVYDTFPLIADRYGAGTQSNGRRRLSFVMMNRDPDCLRLIR